MDARQVSVYRNKFAAHRTKIEAVNSHRLDLNLDTEPFSHPKSIPLTKRPGVPAYVEFCDLVQEKAHTAYDGNCIIMATLFQPNKLNLCRYCLAPYLSVAKVFKN